MNITIPSGNTSAIPVEKIENVYSTILEVQNELNAVYQESSSTMKNIFESIKLFVPEVSKKDLRLSPAPNSQTTNSLSLRQEPPSQRLESFSQTPEQPPSKLLTSSSNWMLKHQGPGSGLIELLPNSGIYVSEAELKQCNLIKTDMRKFGRLLLPVVFSKEALQKCTFSGRSKLNRLAFDEHAKNIFLDYVIKHARESGWEVVSRQNLLQSCNSKIMGLSKHQFKYSPIRIDF